MKSVIKERMLLMITTQWLFIVSSWRGQLSRFVIESDFLNVLGITSSFIVTVWKFCVNLHRVYLLLINFLGKFLEEMGVIWEPN